MSQVMDFSPPNSPLRFTQSAQFATISGKIPDWLIGSPPHIHNKLRQAGATRLPWFEHARQSRPEVARALQQDCVVHRFNEQELNEVLAALPTLEAFAEPLLTDAIKKRFGLQIDVRKTWLFCSRRVKTHDSFADISKDPVIELQKSLKAATQTLLHAALQNFESWETVAGGMDQDERHKSAIYAHYPVSGIAVTGTLLAIAPQAFAALCRELDLGGRYQKKITAFVNPPANPDDAPDAASFGRRGLFKRVEQSALRIHAHLAYMKQDIGEDLYKVLLEVGRNGKNVEMEGRPVSCCFLRLWDIELTGIVAIGKERQNSDHVEKVVVYIPGDPVCSLKEYESTAAFTSALRDRMLTAGYLDFFQSFIPARHRAELLAKLDKCLRPRVWNKARGWYEQQVDRDAKLHLRDYAFTSGVLTAITEQKVRVLKDDALFHAVPTAVEDQRAADQRLQYFESLALQALNLVGFVVPPVGAVMMAVAAAQLTTEVFEGIDSWTRGEWEQGWAYLMDVVENVALMAAMAAAHQGSVTPALEKMTVETPSFIEDLTQVELPNGETRLWKPDLAPFAHDIVLPEGLKPDEFGIYHYQDKTWISVEDKVYSVKPASEQGQFHIEHPTKALGYEPPLRHNGAGAWLHPGDQPLAWEGLKLFRRLGHTAADFSDVTVRRILKVSDTHEVVLRKTLVENERPPALLEDTMRRFQLDQEIQRSAQPDETVSDQAALFDSRYRAMSLPQEAHASTIMRRYPRLPATVADELVRHASPAQREELAQGRVPLRIAEEIRVYQQQVRLTRAYEGLYLQSVNNPDTDMLIMHTLERLPGWPSQLRLEVREGRLQGALFDAVGPIDAPVRKTLVRYSNGYEPFDDQGIGLNGRDNIYSSVLHALPDAARAALGFPGTWEGARLKLDVQNGPLLPRQTLRTVLNMQTTTSGPRSPMRLADGRPGYPLSGKGAMQGFILRDTLLDLIRSTGLPMPARSAESILAALESAGMTRQQIHQRLVQVLDERQALEVSMTAWGDASASLADLQVRVASRTRIHDAIWRYWAETAFSDVVHIATALRLHLIVLTDFPQQLPDFFYNRVSHLELVDIDIDRFAQELPFPLPDFITRHRLLEQFFARFAQVVSLHIVRTEGPAPRGLPFVFNLPTLVVSSFPGLRVLRLVNLNIVLTALELDSLSTFAQLEWLDLSGNLVSLNPPTTMGRLRLRYLGLDRVGFHEWPIWLNELLNVPGLELSLRHNRISELPDYVLTGGTQANPPAEISLQGNPLSRLVLMRARLSQGAARRFRLNLDIPPFLEAQMAELRQERTQLQDAIVQWAEASSSTRPLPQQTVQARRRIGETIMQFWHGYSEGQTFAAFSLEDVSLDDFPPGLPAFFYMRVRNVCLTRVSGSTAQLNQLLASFPQLSSLELIGPTEPLPDLPSALLNLSALTTLSLRDQGRLLDQQVMTLLGRLPGLASLDLSGNQLGNIFDVTRLCRSLRWLSLANTGLDHWPAWVDDLMPLEGLVLDNNQLTELPEHILHNPRNDHAQTEIAVRGNPLTLETMRRAHVSENYHSAYSFVMDFPDDILALPPEHNYSDSDSDSFYSGSDSSGRVNSPDSVSSEDVPVVDAWLLGTPEENQLHRALWQRLENAENAGNLIALMGRLTQAAPYRTQLTRVDFAGRAWRVLEAADQRQESLLLYNGIAAEALMQPDTGAQTCHDGAWLVFNQIEIQVFIEQALANVPTALRGQTLYRLTQRLYRLHELDSIARELAGGRDEAEVRLAYRLRWASELDLPLPPSSMLYQVVASIRPGELDAALVRVQQGERGEPFMRYAAQRDFWVQYLREAYAERFEALKQAYFARVVALPDQFPGRVIEELGEEFAALKQEFDAQEIDLIRELTYREGFERA